MATCELKEKTIKEFKEKNLIRAGNREILDMQEFISQNEIRSAYLKETYNIKSDKLLFDVEVAERTSLRTRTVLRAVPNEDLLNTIQKKIDKFAKLEEDKEVEQTDLFTIDIPTIEFKGMTEEEIVQLENPEEIFNQQKQLEKDIEEFNKLIKCLWS